MEFSITAGADGSLMTLYKNKTIKKDEESRTSSPHLIQVFLGVSPG